MIKKEPAIINWGLRTRETIAMIRSDIEAAEHDLSLYEDKNFDQRLEVMDFIDFQIKQLDELLSKTIQQDRLLLLKERAEKMKSALEEVDTILFEQLRKNIKANVYTPETFRELINQYVDLDLGAYQEEAGYDNLDVFINGLFSHQAMPEQAKELEPEMVHYQKTPARIVFELVKKCNFTKDDVFFDLGSGLGQVAILVNLLSGITTKGIEFEPAFCNYAKNCAAALNLPNITFINVDARRADYSTGTVFFMFTPFKGEILNEVLEILRRESLKRRIRIITYGPCTTRVAMQSWLCFEYTLTESYGLAVFKQC